MAEKKTVQKIVFKILSLLCHPLDKYLLSPFHGLGIEDAKIGEAILCHLGNSFSN